MGKKINTKRVSLALIASIDIKTIVIVIGSRAKDSNELIIELSISLTSEVIRASKSPFLASLK